MKIFVFLLLLGLIDASPDEYTRESHHGLNLQEDTEVPQIVVHNIDPGFPFKTNPNDEDYLIKFYFNSALNKINYVDQTKLQTLIPFISGINLNQTNLLLSAYIEYALQRTILLDESKLPDLDLESRRNETNTEDGINIAEILHLILVEAKKLTYDEVHEAYPQFSLPNDIRDKTEFMRNYIDFVNVIINGTNFEGLPFNDLYKPEINPQLEFINSTSVNSSIVSQILNYRIDKNSANIPTNNMGLNEKSPMHLSIKNKPKIYLKEDEKRIEPHIEELPNNQHLHIPHRFSSSQPIIFPSIPDVIIPEIPKLYMPPTPNIKFPDFKNELKLPQLPVITPPSPPDIQFPKLPEVKIPTPPDIVLPDLPFVRHSDLHKIHLAAPPNSISSDIPKIQHPNLPKVDVFSSPNIIWPKQKILVKPTDLHKEQALIQPNITSPEITIVHPPNLPNKHVFAQSTDLHKTQAISNISQLNLITQPVELSEESNISVPVNAGSDNTLNNSTYTKEFPPKNIHIPQKTQHKVIAMSDNTSVKNKLSRSTKSEKTSITINKINKNTRKGRSRNDKKKRNRIVIAATSSQKHGLNRNKLPSIRKIHSVPFLRKPKNNSNRKSKEKSHQSDRSVIRKTGHDHQKGPVSKSPRQRVVRKSTVSAKKPKIRIHDSKNVKVPRWKLIKEKWNKHNILYKHIPEITGVIRPSKLRQFGRSAVDKSIEESSVIDDFKKYAFGLNPQTNELPEVRHSYYELPSSSNFVSHSLPKIIFPENPALYRPSVTSRSFPRFKTIFLRNPYSIFLQPSVSKLLSSDTAEVYTPVSPRNLLPNTFKPFTSITKLIYPTVHKMPSMVQKEILSTSVPNTNVVSEQRVQYLSNIPEVHLTEPNRSSAPTPIITTPNSADSQRTSELSPSVPNKVIHLRQDVIPLPIKGINTLLVARGPRFLTKSSNGNLPTATHSLQYLNQNMLPPFIRHVPPSVGEVTLPRTPSSSESSASSIKLNPYIKQNNVPNVPNLIADLISKLPSSLQKNRNSFTSETTPNRARNDFSFRPSKLYEISQISNPHLLQPHSVKFEYSDQEIGLESANKLLDILTDDNIFTYYSLIVKIVEFYCSNISRHNWYNYQLTSVEKYLQEFLCPKLNLDGYEVLEDFFDDIFD